MGGRKSVGLAGYGVVDPMPLPASCPDPKAFDVRLKSARWSSNTVVVTLDTPPQSPGYLKTATAHETQVTVTITGVDSLKVECNGAWPRNVSVYLGVECLAGGSTAIATVTLGLDTSWPLGVGDVPAEIIQP